MTFTYVPAIDRTTPEVLPKSGHRFSITLTSGRVVEVTEANSYQPEGPLTTFFRSGSSSRTIDTWAERVASFRTVDIVSIRQREEPRRRHPSANNPSPVDMAHEEGNGSEFEFDRRLRVVPACAS